jgi:hypothetical protein
VEGPCAFSAHLHPVHFRGKHAGMDVTVNGCQEQPTSFAAERSLHVEGSGCRSGWTAGVRVCIGWPGRNRNLDRVRRGKLSFRLYAATPVLPASLPMEIRSAHYRCGRLRPTSRHRQSRRPAAARRGLQMTNHNRTTFLLRASVVNRFSCPLHADERCSRAVLCPTRVAEKACLSRRVGCAPYRQRYMAA